MIKSVAVLAVAASAAALAIWAIPAGADSTEDGFEYPLQCYAASILGGLQLQQDGDGRAQTYLDEASYWKARISSDQDTVNAAINRYAADKYVYEMLDQADACRLKREGKSDEDVETYLADKIAAEQQRLAAQRAQVQGEEDSRCMAVIEPAMDRALSFYDDAGKEAAMWVSTGRYGQNYAFGSIAKGCSLLRSAGNRINQMQCSAEVYRSFQKFYDSYYLSVPGVKGGFTIGCND
ncbi:MAG: hypothetical protein IE933_13750 [Sphingomonadales bacterium]|nr:hypothetical protein [Sphingomonadales bacterium]MBD3774637.1 hypothetical protein [Paracoccaceae bacterium]